MLGFKKSSQEREKLHVPCWWSLPPRPGSAVPAAAESPAPARHRQPAGPWGRRAMWSWPRAPRQRWRHWGRAKGHSLASLGGDPARPRQAATAASAAWLRAPPAGRGWILRRKWGTGGLGFRGNQIRLGSRGGFRVQWRLTRGGVPGSARRRGPAGAHGQPLPAGERREAAAADEFFGREKRNQIGSQKSRAGNRTRDAGKRAGGKGVR